MTDPVLRQLFRDQSGRLWRDFLPAWESWLSRADTGALTRLRHLVHTLKGSALGLDHLALADACHSLESAWAAVPPEPDALAAWSRLRPLWRAHVDDGAMPELAPAAMEAAVSAFFRRTAEQLGVPAELHCRLAPAWVAERMLLWDVLPHLLRNALTHGREPAAVRGAAGKPERLRVWVRGLSGEGWLRLLVADDGAGRGRAAGGAPDLWAGRGQGVAAVRAAVAAHGGGGQRPGRVQWRGRAGRGGVARISIFSI